VPTSATMAIFVSRTENTASAAARRMSQAVMRSTPAPMHQPWTAAITGWGTTARAVTAFCILVPGARRARRRATAGPASGGQGGGECLQVETDAERPSPTGDDDHPHRLVLPQRLHHRGEVGPERGRHGVELVGAVEPHRGHVPVDLDGHHLRLGNDHEFRGYQ